MLHANNSPVTHAIIGAMIEVHKAMGKGYREAVYQRCLEMEFQDRGIPNSREVPIPIHYKGRHIGKAYSADFVCFGRILVELKCQQSVGEVEAAQVIHYLKGTGLQIALLANFGEPTLGLQRFVGESARESLNVSGASVARPA
ncbi:MAG: GxxExxY protein [Thermoplasmatota archaeon]|nr:GxxExxY protein [Halobacteriales archaeon]